MKIAEILEQRGKTAYWLAKQSNLVYATVDGLVKGKKKGIDFNTLDAICRVLECQPGDLVVFENDSEIETSNFKQIKESKK